MWKVIQGPQKTEKWLQANTYTGGENKVTFQLRLPKGLPPNWKVNQWIKSIGWARIPFQRRYQLSPSKFVASKQYIGDFTF